jgi:hypothetical protein
MPTRKPKPPANADNPEQSKRFIDMAREVEADESPGTADRAFNRVVPRQSAPTPSAPRSPRSSKKVGEL